MFDLHLHSTVSDGLWSPAQLLAEIQERAITSFALTDHDDTRGVSEIKASAEAAGLHCIPGVEISCLHGQQGVHILAYGIDLEDTELQACLSQHRRAKQSQIRRMLSHLRNERIDIAFDELLAGRPEDSYVGRGHLARALVPRYLRHQKLAYQHYLGRDASAYVPAKLSQAVDVIALIHQAGGLAVLAHPSHDDLSLRVKALAEAGLDGLEALRPRRSRSFREKILSAAHHHGLFITGGSDWHGVGETLAFGEFTVEASELKKFRAALSQTASESAS